jgi:peptidoglycan hydrolase-like protein with peptidoglycan-binding domain
MAWDPTKHARAPKGPGGGEFSAGSAPSSSKSTAPKRPTAKRPTAKRRSAGRTVPKGSLGFNGKTGTGYGKKGGDARVRKLQQALNKLGLRDAQGKPLAVDGDLGPKTTAAIKAWQHKNKMPATGFLDAASLRKLGGSGRTTHHVRAGAASRTANKPTVAAGRRATPRSTK